MKTVTCKLTGISPLGFSRPVRSIKTTGEAHDAFEERTWKERAHADQDGLLFIPPQNIKNMLGDVAKYLSETIPGKGKQTYTKNFEAGAMVTDPTPIFNGNGKPIPLDDVECDRVFVPSDGRRGGGTRVWKQFPIVRAWSLSPIVHLLDPVLIDDRTDIIQRYFAYAGQFIGLGYFRPRRNGYYGRFEVSDFKVVT